MKIFLAFFLLAVCNLTIFAQVAQKCVTNQCVIDSSIKTLQNFEKKYDCNNGSFISNKSFSELINQVFSRVVVRNDDLVKNGTATNIKIDDKDKTISGNANFKVNNAVFWNIGVAGKTEGKALSLFQGGVYSKGFTISTGFDIKTSASIFYDIDSCTKLTAIRVKSNFEILKKLYGYLSFDTTRIISEINSLKEKISLDVNINTITANLSADVSKTLSELSKKEDSLKFYREVFEKTFKDNKHISQYLKDAVSNIEVKNATTNGYTLHWINLNTSFSNQGYNIFDTSITSRFFNDTLKSKYFRQYILAGTYNYVRNTKRLLLFAYGGLSLQNQFGLQDFKFKKDTLIGSSSAIVEKNSIQAIDVTEISSSYNKSYFGFTPQAGGFAFFGKNKVFGIEAFASVNIKNKTPELIEHRPSYSFRLGALFSLAKADGVVSNGTLGLLASVNNYVFGKKDFSNAISLGIRLGIPFNNIKLQ